MGRGGNQGNNLFYGEVPRNKQEEPVSDDKKISSKKISHLRLR
jgi:hypothetical protein